jgi:roadblock/LC7 domain-containing protein
MNGSGLIVVMFTQGNSDLQYNIGQLSGSGSSTSIEWNATLVGYAGGDHASVVMNDNGCIVEVHSDGGDLYYNVGAVSGSSITWNSVDASNSPAPLPLHVEGAHTALALRSDGLVCLIYDKDSSTYYGLGMLDATNKKINWITLNNRYNQGAYAALDFAPDGRIVETHQRSESDDALFWNIGAVTTP